MKEKGFFKGRNRYSDVGAKKLARQGKSGIKGNRKRIVAAAMAFFLLQPWAVLEAYASEEGITVLEESAKEEETDLVNDSELEVSEEETTSTEEENEFQNVGNTTVASEPQSEASDAKSDTANDVLTETLIESRAADETLKNPWIVEDSSMMAKQKVTWDCVWFGSYPQSEVKSSDVVYSTLQNTTGWDADGDITVEGNRYRRMKKGDAAYSSSDNGYYNWTDSTTYHYFKYEPIKWRVLKADGNQAFLLADVALDAQRYHKEDTEADVTWEASTIRSWLNDAFFSNAFTDSEQSAVVISSVVNANNKAYGTEGGNDTTDKVFLMSENEVCGDVAKVYGFVPNTTGITILDEARRCESSTYAKAMGVCSDASELDIYKGNWCWWWLRTPGSSTDCVEFVYDVGSVENMGVDVYASDDAGGVRPALNLNLSSSQWSYAGTVCSEDTVKEENNGGNSGSIGNDNKPSINTPNKPDMPNVPVKVSEIKLSGISKKTAAGKKVQLTAVVSPGNAANKAVTWQSSNTKVATVNASGVVSMNKKSGGKSVVITATAQDGSGVKATYNIKSMKGVVKKVSISGKKTVKAGKALKLKGQVKATKNANKKLKWTSSNTKYANVTGSGKVKTYSAGKGKKVKITAKATDGSGKKKSVTIKIK